MIARWDRRKEWGGEKRPNVRKSGGEVGETLLCDEQGKEKGRGRGGGDRRNRESGKVASVIAGEESTKVKRDCWDL